MELMQNFGLTFSKYLRENSRQLLIKMLGLLAVLVVLALWIGYAYNMDSYAYYMKYDLAHSTELAFFAIILLFLAMGGASEVMAFMNTKEHRISTLMTPSTQLSKFLSAWIINVPVLVGVYMAFAYFADFVRYAVYSSLDIPDTYVMPFSFKSNDIPSEVIQAYFMFVIFLQSLFVLGGTIWSSRAYIKTIIALVAVGLVYSALVSLGFNLTMRGGHYHRIFSDEPSLTAMWIANIAVSLGIYVLAYFRFKESEIINRW